MTLGRGQISLNFDYHVNSKIFIPNFVCVFTNKRKKTLNRIFIPLLGSYPRDGTLGVLGGSKTLAWGFAMVPHRLRILSVYLQA